MAFAQMKCKMPNKVYTCIIKSILNKIQSNGRLLSTQYTSNIFMFGGVTLTFSQTVLCVHAIQEQKWSRERDIQPLDGLAEARDC